MKRIFLLIIMFLSFDIQVNAIEKDEVKFSKCVDGDTIKVLLGGKERTVRLLAVDTPESVHPSKGVEYFGKEASEFTCNSIKNAKKIELEYDENSDKEDKYDRLLAWVFIDDELLQDKLIQGGYAEVAYLYGDYKYTNLLKDHQAVVETKEIGIWNKENCEKYNNQNDIKENVENVDDSYSDDEIEGTIDDVIDKIDKLNIDWKNITLKDIRNILFIIIASIIVAMWKPVKKKLKKKLR